MGYQLTRRVILTIWSLLIIVPLIVVVSGTFKTSGELFDSPFGLPSRISADNYTEVLGGQDLAGAFRNSTVVTLASVALTLLIGSLAGYGIARIPGGGGGRSTGSSSSAWPSPPRPT